MKPFGLEAGGPGVAQQSAVWARLAFAFGRLVVLSGALAGCHANALTDTGAGGQQNAPVASGTCTPGRAGCACTEVGATAACGKLVGQYGDYITCSTGESTCQGGHWSACEGNKLVTKSVGGATLGAGGIRLLTTTPACADICDPGCIETASNVADVDGSRLVPTAAPDGALTAVTIGATNAPTCVGLQCQVATCAPGNTTTLTGTVYDPAGVHPLYNADVFVPVDPTGALPAFHAGASCDTCAGAGDLNAVAVAKTGPDGKFVLTNVPSTDVAPGAPIPVVVQLGKWRREQILTSVPKCATTPVAPSQSRLPRNESDGNGNQADLPKIAIATGKQDPFECLLLKIGVDPAEFQIPSMTGTRRVDYYLGNGAPFSGQTAPSETTLENNLTTLMQYDVVILPCQGAALDTTRLPYADNVAAYANAGGRVFATHDSYGWLAMTTNTTANAINPATGAGNPFFGVAEWHLGAGTYSTAIPASIETTLPGPPVASFPKGVAFDSWLEEINAFQSGGPGPDGGATQVISIDEARHDVDGINAPATEWIQHAASPSEPLSFSFDTPLTASDAGAGDASVGAGACGRVVFSDFHVSTSDLTPAGDACNSNTDCGYTATCKVPSVVGTCAGPVCYASSTCAPGSSCTGGSLGTCTQTATPCMASTDCQSGVCTNGTCAPPTSGCSANGTFPCGKVETCTGSVAGACTLACATNTDCTSGQLCVAGQCQGCYGNTQCPSGMCNGAGPPSTCIPTSTAPPYSSTAFPYSCKQGVSLTPQEDALEFMLFDLTACISPDTEPPPLPPSTPLVYDPATFTEDFTQMCPEGTRVVWQEFDWQATVPDGASIVFSAQTADPGLDGAVPDWTTVQSAALATATTSTILPTFNAALLDTGPPVVDGGLNGAFSGAVPRIFSASQLHLTVTMNPTPDRTTPPTLIDWTVKSDCLPSE